MPPAHFLSKRVFSRMSEFPQNSTIILVHGAWADGSCWSNIILPLQQRGLHVICAPIPMTSLTDDATALSRVLEHTSGPLVLVGHAYSGAVIAAVREDRAKVAGLCRGARARRRRDRRGGFLSRPAASGTAEAGSRFPWLHLDARRWVSPGSCPQSFRRSNQHCNCCATANRGSVHSRARACANVESETVVVSAGRRRPHD